MACRRVPQACWKFSQALYRIFELSTSVEYHRGRPRMVERSSGTARATCAPTSVAYFKRGALKDDSGYNCTPEEPGTR